jgi:hypothetical protein
MLMNMESGNSLTLILSFRIYDMLVEEEKAETKTWLQQHHCKRKMTKSESRGAHEA